MRFSHFCGISSDRTTFTPAPVSGKHMDSCIAAVDISYDNRSLYVGLDVRATSIDVGANFKGSRLRATAPLGLVLEDWLSG